MSKRISSSDFSQYIIAGGPHDETKAHSHDYGFKLAELAEKAEAAQYDFHTSNLALLTDEEIVHFVVGTSIGETKFATASLSDRMNEAGITWQGQNSIGNEPTPTDVICCLCHADLIFHPFEVTSNESDPPMTVVMSCGHWFHIQCLSGTGYLPNDCEDPPCVLCTGCIV